MSRNVLIVEDDVDIGQLLTLHLGDLNCSCTIFTNGLEATQHLRENPHYDMLILDIMLPGCDGLSLCRDVRARDARLPIMMLTAKTTELDRVLGLEMGADDYLTKPFSFMELTARVKALFRRNDALLNSQTDTVDTHIKHGDLSINLASREVHIVDRSITLTAREFDLLVYFARHPAQVFTRSQLLDSVWGYCHDGYEHTVNTHINRLRNKIEVHPDTPEYIRTVWGVGYQFALAQPHTQKATGNVQALANPL